MNIGAALDLKEFTRPASAGGSDTPTNIGVVLNNTGAGGLTVSGNGGTCTTAGSCTGGAIQNKTGDSIFD